VHGIKVRLAQISFVSGRGTPNLIIVFFFGCDVEVVPAGESIRPRRFLPANATAEKYHIEEWIHNVAFVDRLFKVAEASDLLKSSGQEKSSFLNEEDDDANARINKSELVIACKNRPSPELS
jgi:hypothetical protein